MEQGKNQNHISPKQKISSNDFIVNEIIKTIKGDNNIFYPKQNKAKPFLYHEHLIDIIEAISQRKEIYDIINKRREDYITMDDSIVFSYTITHQLQNYISSIINNKFDKEKRTNIEYIINLFKGLHHNSYTNHHITIFQIVQQFDISIGSLETCRIQIHNILDQQKHNNSALLYYDIVYDSSHFEGLMDYFNNIKSYIDNIITLEELAIGWGYTEDEILNSNLIDEIIQDTVDQITDFFIRYYIQQYFYIHLEKQLLDLKYKIHKKLKVQFSSEILVSTFDEETGKSYIIKPTITSIGLPVKYNKQIRDLYLQQPEHTN